MRVDRYVFAGIKEGADLVGVQFRIRERDNADQTLRLRTIVSVVVFSCIHLKTNILIEVSQLFRLECQVVPTRNWGFEIVVEKRVVVAIVGPSTKRASPLRRDEGRCCRFRGCL